eukprot:3728660-Rhodomonas_salina.1
MSVPGLQFDHCHQCWSSGLTTDVGTGAQVNPTPRQWSKRRQPLPRSLSALPGRDCLRRCCFQRP